MKTTKDLKPCPFCGGEPLMVHSALNEYHSVASKIGCSHCRYIIQAPDLAIDMDKSVKENCDFEDWQTISYWNTRPVEDALKAEVERLKETLSGITPATVSCLEPKAITNGDVIRQMSNEEYAEEFGAEIVILKDFDGNPFKAYRPLFGELCETRAEAKTKSLEWLNAPAESEGEDE